MRIILTFTILYFTYIGIVSGQGVETPKAAPETPKSESAPAENPAVTEESQESDEDSQPALPAVKQPKQSDIFGPFEVWLAEKKPTEAIEKEINLLRQQVQPNMDDGRLLELLVKMISTADARFQPFFTPETLSARIYPVEKLTLISDALDAPDWVTEAVNLQAARHLANNGLFDEAQSLLEDLKPERSPCPASLLFYQGLVKYQSLNKKAAKPILNRLLEMEAIPFRYKELAQRMVRDLDKLKEKSLDHISRRMGDVAGRLDSGRANDKTIEIEDGIVKDLDEQIKKLEEELEKMQQQMAQSQSQNLQPNSPGERTELPSGGGKGKAEKKNVGDSSGWGDLPEKEREKDLQQIQENFPPHYRDIIEQYFKRMSQ